MEAMMNRKPAGMNRAFSADGLALDELLGRCPRLPYEVAPLALGGYRVAFAESEKKSHYGV
jgi:hypothetical protein